MNIGILCCFVLKRIIINKQKNRLLGAILCFACQADKRISLALYFELPPLYCSIITIIEELIQGDSLLFTLKLPISIKF